MACFCNGIAAILRALFRRRRKNRVVPRITVEDAEPKKDDSTTAEQKVRT